MSKVMTLFLMMLLAGTFNGCVTLYEKVGENPLTNHRSPLVRHPAFTGLFAGVIIGLPLDIPVIPAGMLLYECNNEIEVYRVICVPSLVLGAIGETALGVPSWCLFGWWWPEENVTMPIVSDEKNPEHPALGSRQNDINAKSP